jgi:hypothetical protein
MTAPENIHKLVETFEQNLSEVHTGKNEMELRREEKKSVQRQIKSTNEAPHAW